MTKHKHRRASQAENARQAAPVLEFVPRNTHIPLLLDSRHMAARGAQLFSSAYNKFNSRRVCDRAARIAANA